MEQKRAFRGISKRLAAQYLESLGGERADEAGDRIEGDGWSADLEERTVSPAGSITLTEVSIRFAGDREALEPLIEAFERKAVRAGG